MTETIRGNIDDILSREYEDFVRTCYREILLRDAEPSGLSSHLDALDRGVPKVQILASIASSDEACLNGMATSHLAISARRRAHMQRKFLYPLLGNRISAVWAERIFERTRAARKSRLETGASRRARTEYRPVVTTATSDWRVPPPASRATVAATNANAGPAQAFRKLVDGRSGHPASPAPDIASSPATRSFETLWVDMTTAFEWTGGVVGIVRTELEMACGLRKVDPTVRFSMQVGTGFAEIPAHELQWLLTAENVTDAYMRFFGRQRQNPSDPKSIHLKVPTAEGFFHPYGANDIIVSFGWMESSKEGYFSRLKARIPSIRIGYLIYDIILLLDETAHFYDENGRVRFKNYIRWVSHNADFLLFGGETAKRDTETLQRREGWPILQGRAVQFGTDIAKSVDADAVPRHLNDLGITGPFIMTVGSIEPRKNHDTLYRAYILVLERLGDEAPQLVIIGKPLWRVHDLVDSLRRDPRLAGKVIMCTPTDEQLAALYANCQFTLLPSIYEGWSLTLPESLGQGKYCLSCDTPPLREIGRSLVDYVDRFDVRGWADKIIELCTNPTLLAAKSKTIVEEWPTTLWRDTAEMVYKAVCEFDIAIQQRSTPKSDRNAKDHGKPTIWLDMTLTYLQWNGGLSGVIRTELTFAYFLHKLAPNTRFFAHVDGNFFEISQGRLSWLFDAVDLSTSYQQFHDFWHRYESVGTGSRNPLAITGRPTLDEAYIASFPENAILLFVGIDSDGSGKLSRNREVLELIPPHSRVMTSQLIYDFTPILLPHCHIEATCAGYKPFIEFVSDHFDHLIYGGRTALRDGVSYQRANALKVPPSDFIEFGSNLDLLGRIETADQGEDEAILQSLGITADFAMTVGTIEPRKNHEMLYKAYLRMMDIGALEKPFQLAFVGKQGWKSDDFITIFNSDDRVRGKILLLTPTDRELAALYRQCRFTLLPSFYEGWSLTLPESLSYGKFCLASDVEPLRETGQDLVEYIHPLDTYRWADRIAHYANHPAEVARWEAQIKSRWKPLTWEQSTARLLEILYHAHAAFVQRGISGSTP